MKKLFALSTAALLALGLASCGEDKPQGEVEQGEGKAITLTYSGTASNKDFNVSLFEKFKEARKAAGDKNTYTIEYLEIGPDKIDSEIQHWEEGPDVYEFASDKITGLYQKGALAKLSVPQAKWVKENNSELGANLAQFNGATYAYPFTGDNTYYFQYDKSLIDETKVGSIEEILKVCGENSLKFGYNLEEAFWGAAAMFTFGADYKMEFNVDGSVKNVEANFDGPAGQKAIKALQKIMSDKSWTNEMKAPTPDNKFLGCIAGTWDIPAYKEKLGENYGCAPMPTITIDGETKNLGAFLGGKLFGVNPYKSAGDKEQLKAAHELAKFLSNEESQLARFENQNVAPCNVKAAANEMVTKDINVKCLIEQAEHAHEQTAVPGNFWTAPATLVKAIKEANGAELDYATLAKTFNDTIKASK